MNAATIVTKTRNGYTVTTVRHFVEASVVHDWLVHMRNSGAPADAAAEAQVLREQAWDGTKLAESYFSNK